MNTGKLNPVIDTVNTLFYFCMLNLVFLITCVPVFTTGTALASLYYVLFKEAKGESGYLVRVYLREFRRNLKNGTTAFVILFAAGAVLLFNLLYWPAQKTLFSSIITGVLVFLLIVWLVISHYTYPLIGRFINTPVHSIKNAWGLALRNLKQTFLLLLLDAGVVACYLFLPLKIVLLAIPVCAAVLPAYGRAHILVQVFAPYEKQ